jgi:hypothetical protein
VDCATIFVVESRQLNAMMLKPTIRTNLVLAVFNVFLLNVTG